MCFRQITALFCASVYLFLATPMADTAAAVDVVSATANSTYDAAASDTEFLPDKDDIIPSPHKMQVDGTDVKPQAYFLNGYNYYKLRDIAYLLRGTSVSFNVGWDSATKTIYLFNGIDYIEVGGEMITTDVKIRYVYSSSTTVSHILCNEREISLHGYCINGNNYYRIADIAEALDFPVSYDNDTRTVHIVTTQPPSDIDNPEKPDDADTKPSDSTEKPDDGDAKPSDSTEKPDDGNTKPSDDSKPFVTGVYEVKVNSSLSIRTGPGLSYASVGSLLNGTKIVVDDMVDGWAHMQGSASGNPRYCKAEYLERVSDDKEISPTDTTWTSAPNTPTTPNNPTDPDESTDPTDPTTPTDPTDPITPTDPIDSKQPEEPEPPKEPRTSQLDGIKTVIIDPGHGGKDGGAAHPTLDLDEKHVNLAVAQYLKSYLEEAGVTVIMVRDNLEDGASLSLRGAVMEKHIDSVDLFFGLHHNSSESGSARGAQVLAQIADEDGGPTKILAEELNREYERIGLPVRNIWFREGEHGDYYYTNRKAASLQITAVISEFCFIDNDDDVKFIDSDQDWQTEAHGLCNAILRYFEQVEY